MAKLLNEKQYAAIAILAQPNRGGLKYDEVAERVGVSRQTLYEWRKDDAFNDELKRQIMRNTLDRLPDVMASIPDHIINDGNAAMFRTLLQAHGMLTDKVEVEAKGGQATDVSQMKAEIERMRQRRKDGE
ncbi:phBC6A51 family helix-turn-helix protein [Robertmurraya sp. DFI.2.37]|uniref:phBC6A51 family helix-turn-helix protein n=1 Tax=Robertmurraya sp. DFI.2.37 TaxID=3031819 RepID=UPI0012492B5E|nr:phBC6A51 family helix-turn-helix protein [Robertmurraya sp. DFI.2.37]MDF1510866.1 phBC6A51 family helix-turn-helix protein [Robertmurraya sp. DFI.2.37]